ncbi:MAG: hypothetical protein Q4C20_00725 [Erysipelotrichaceae bacterium]|nr:hypothetical protein [Erysipelotrichaceae bacterium]
MNKGLIAAAAALTFAVAAPVTVYAEEAKSPSADEAKIVIEERSENAGVKVGDTAAVVNAAWGTNIEDGYVVVFVGEAYVSGETDKELTLTVNAADFKGGQIFVHHKKDGSNDVGATVTLNSKDLSPVATLKRVDNGSTPATPSTPAGNNTANTGDSNKTGLWAGALVISALLAGAALVMNKRNA